MFGAAWWGFGEDAEDSRTRGLDLPDPLWHLAADAYSSEQTFHQSRWISQPERSGQFVISLWTKPVEIQGAQVPDSAQLGAARRMAVEMISGAIHSATGGSFDAGASIGRMPILDELATALAWGRFSHLRSGFVSSDANTEAASRPSSQVASGSQGDGSAGGPSNGSMSTGLAHREQGPANPRHVGFSTNGRSPMQSETTMMATSSTMDDDFMCDWEPTAEDDSFDVGHDQTLVVPDDGVLWNDDLGFEEGVLDIVSGPSYAATFTPSTGGGFTYEPQPNTAEPDSFTYKITNSVGSSEATVTIGVINFPPVPVDDVGYDGYELMHDTTLTVTDPEEGVRGNDYDNDHELVDVKVSILDDPSHAQDFNLALDGTFYYIPDPGYAGGDSFTYTLHDGIEGSDPTDPGEVTLSVINFAPQVGDDGPYTVVTGETITIDPPGLRANDYDPNGEQFTLNVETGPYHGTLGSFDADLNADGEGDGGFTYTANLGYAGPDSFTYRGDDGAMHGVSELATVSINVVLPVPDIDTDSNNDGVIDELDDPEGDPSFETADPGKIVQYNGDDDNGNLTADRDESPLVDGQGELVADDDLTPALLSIDPVDADLTGMTLQLAHTGNLKLWKTLDKQPLPLSYTIGTDPIPGTIYIEGYDPGPGTVDWILLGSAGEVSRDTVKYLVVKMDIDTDSDNTGIVARSQLEDCLEDVAGAGVFQVGKRIFQNNDDDNKNGKADRLDSKTDYLPGEKDKDFAEIKLDAEGISSLAGYSLWLGADAGLKVWGDEQMTFLRDWPTPPDGGVNLPWDPAYEPLCGTWYYWTIGSTGANYPETLHIEGWKDIEELEQFGGHAYWRLVEPGGSGAEAANIVARDTVEINIERIVWPNQDPAAVWDPHENTLEWNGFELESGWFIEKSLGEIINGSTGYIRTQYPKETEPGRWEGTSSQKDSLTKLDLAKLCGTQEWGDNETVRIKLAYEFEQSPKITKGQFVDTDLVNRWQASFFHNSGVKIENRAEIQIFDTASLLSAIIGSDETIDGSVVTMVGDVNEVNSEGYVKLRHGTPPVYSRVVDPTDYAKCVISGIPYNWDDKLLSETWMERLQRAPMGGQTMVIEVSKDVNGDYACTVTIDGHTNTPPYHIIGGEGDPDGMLYLQSHWASGVKFTSAKVKKL